MDKVDLLIPQQPIIPTIKLKVVKSLRVGDVFYTEGHDIEVFHAEAVQLLTSYADYFEVVVS